MEPFRPQELSALFAKFAGKEVPLVNKPLERKGKSYDNFVLANENDPVLTEMKQLANESGFLLRVWWPGMAGTMDFRTDRVNAHIEQADDGKWRLRNQFDIG